MKRIYKILIPFVLCISLVIQCSVTAFATTNKNVWLLFGYIIEQNGTQKEKTISKISDDYGYDSVTSVLNSISTGTITDSDNVSYTLNPNADLTIKINRNYANAETIGKLTINGTGETVAASESDDITITHSGTFTIDKYYPSTSTYSDLNLTFNGMEIGSGANVVLDQSSNNYASGPNITYQFNDDVTVEGSLTLSGNGYGLGTENTSNGNGADGNIEFASGKGIVVKDGGELTVGNVNISKTSGDDSVALITVEDGGTLNVTTDGGYSYSIMNTSGTAIDLKSGAEATIDCGVISSSSGSAIKVEQGATVEFTVNSNNTDYTTGYTTVTTTAESEDAIDLASGSTVTIDGISYTVSSSVAEGASNYVDNDGLLHLTSGATVTLSDDSTATLDDILANLVLDGADCAVESGDGESGDYTIKSVSEVVSSDTIKTTAGTSGTNVKATDDAEDSVTADTYAITATGIGNLYADIVQDYIDGITDGDVVTVEYARQDTFVGGYDSTTGKLTYEIEPLIVYTLKDQSNTVISTETEVIDLSGIEANVTVTLPDDAKTAWSGSLESVQAAHTYGGNVEYLLPTATTDRTLTYTTDKGFSEWQMVLLSTTSDNSAQNINVTFSEYTDAQSNVVPGKYYINVTGDKDIYRFMAAQLMFDLESSDAIAYTIEPVTDNGVSMTTSSTADGTVYEFNMDTTSAASQNVTSGTAFAIGIVTFTGVGTVDSFGVDSSYSDNMVQAAVKDSVDNNIVKTYTVGGSTSTATSGNLNIAAQLTNIVLSLDEVDLTINVVFPNSVDEQIADYTDMQINLSNVLGDDTIYLGSGVSNVTYDKVTIDSEDYNAYIVTTTVPKNYATTFEFVGAGYRTYRTSITPTGDATVTVWNNVMDSEDTVVIDESYDAMGGVKNDVTFLAGDIVMDYNINLYDLSAVVSYFGKTNTVSAASEFTKYDLNRDGKIDSKDIAMVLVSWDK
ncbi:MAG: dockerin type I domain-containing protein [Oscillospiraceae bacterium]|nr:dockerin type I domain-containing protein [Oscillospiraceae bacterium]